MSFLVVTVMKQDLSFMSFVLTLNKELRVSGMDEAARNKVAEEVRLLACLRDTSIVR